VGNSGEALPKRGGAAPETRRSRFHLQSTGAGSRGFCGRRDA
jgi:hypothetical protein